MKNSILARRDDIAQARIIAAIGKLAVRFGVDVPSLDVRARAPAVRAMLQREIVADFLESLIDAKPKRTRKKAS
jgi:hypothetical protein